MTVRALPIIEYLHLLLYALVLGVFWGTWFSLSRSITSITPPTFLEVGKTMMGNLGGPMSILMPAAILTALPALFLLYRAGAGASLALMALGFALLIVALIITLTVNVPIDFQIRDWTVHTLPPEWTDIRDRWQRFHTARTAASLAGFACALAASLRALPDGRTRPL